VPPDKSTSRSEEHAPTQQAKDVRYSRGETTKQALMRAAEKLIAEKGIENVTIRDIVQSAGQKNESALQYHFRNLKGLIAALHASRNAQIQAKRSALLTSLNRDTSTPTLRNICQVMVAPAFELAKSKPDFRRYIRAFGHEITAADESALRVVNRKGGEGALQTGLLLRNTLPHLDDDAYQRRMDGALRFVSASMVHHARQKNAFRGDHAELFFHSLIDALEGMLSAPQSDETRRIAMAMKKHDHKGT
jgi:AcrR family transcriptional regulator